MTNDEQGAKGCDARAVLFESVCVPNRPFFAFEPKCLVVPRENVLDCASPSSCLVPDSWSKYGCYLRLIEFPLYPMA